MPAYFNHGKVLFSGGKVAMNPRCCCGSGSGSGGSGSGGPGSACCIDERGQFWIAGSVSILWPAHLFASLPAACCADLAGPWTLNPQDPSILGGGVAVWYTTSIFGLHIPDCTGAGSWSFNIDVTCEPAGGGLGNVWVIRLSGTMFDGQSGVAQQLTSLSCLPMHLRLANQNIVNPNPATLGVWCVGSTPVEITQ